jgi:hypothetical protein
MLAALFDTHVVGVGLLYSMVGSVCILVYAGVCWVYAGCMLGVCLVYAEDTQTSSISMAGRNTV